MRGKDYGVVEGTLSRETELPVPLGSRSDGTGVAAAPSNGNRAATSMLRVSRRTSRLLMTSRPSACFGLPRGDRTPAGGSHCFG
jgi:hypothetical protein